MNACSAPSLPLLTPDQMATCLQTIQRRNANYPNDSVQADVMALAAMVEQLALTQTADFRAGYAQALHDVVVNGWIAEVPNE